MKMKKFTAFTLAICLLLSMGSLTAFATEDIAGVSMVDGITYAVSIQETDTMRISSVQASDGTWAISIYDIVENTLRVITDDSDVTLSLDQSAPDRQVSPFSVNYVNDIWWGATSTKDDAFLNVVDPSMGTKYGYYWELRCPLSSSSAPTKSFYDYGTSRRTYAENFTSQVNSMRTYEVRAENAVGTGNAYSIQKDMLANGTSLAKLQSMVTALGYPVGAADHFYGAWQALLSARSSWSAIN